MNPPSVYDETNPNNHSTSRITKIFQSISRLLMRVTKHSTFDAMVTGRVVPSAREYTDRVNRYAQRLHEGETAARYNRYEIARIAAKCLICRQFVQSLK